MILECLRLAVQAPTGSNDQLWRWLVVTDPEKRVALAELYRAGLVESRAAYGARPAHAITADVSRSDQILESSRYLAEHLHEVPVLVIPCIASTAGTVAGWGPSIYPAVWSFMLALRSRGLGSCITTPHLYRSAEVAALLGIPDGIAQSLLLPVAYFTGEDFRPASRRPVEEVTYWDEWGATVSD